MVLLGGLELAAAGYIIHQHQKNKKERQRLEDERLEQEEEEYRHRPSRRRHRSHSPRRHSNRRHSHDGRTRYDSPKPKVRPAVIPVAQPIQPMQQPMQQPPPRYDAGSAPPRPQGDVKYGWSDDNLAPPSQQQNAQPQPQAQTFPVTGIPAEWGRQAAGPSSSTYLAPQPSYQRAGSSEGRLETRGRVSDSGPRPRVRFAVSDVDGRPVSPPPRYRP